MAWLIIMENLSTEVTEDGVRALLAPHSEVLSVRLSRTEAGAEPTLVAVAEVDSSRQGCAAIAALDGQDHAGRPLRVRVLKETGARAQGGAAGMPYSVGRKARASIYGEKGAAAGHRGIGKGGGRGR
jgi:nucleolin